MFQLNNNRKAFFIFNFLFLNFFSFSLNAQVCCPTTNREVIGDLESTLFSASFPFPNSILSPVNNAQNFNSAIGENYQGWNITSTTFFDFDVIEDASRSKDGNKFIYIGYPNGVGSNNYCLSNNSYNISGIQNACTPSNTTKQLLPGHTYRIAFDWIAFDKSNPDGTIATTTPHAEYWYAPSASLINIPIFDVNGNVIPPNAGKAWNTIDATTWQRAYGSFTVPDTAPQGNDLIKLYFSHLNSDNSGMLIDNMEVVEVGMTDAGLAAISCDNNNTPNDNTDDLLKFYLNPTGSVGKYLGTKYNVTAGFDYTITPTEAFYGVYTLFTLSKNNSASSGNVTITLTDKTNTDCTISTIVPEPKCISCNSANQFQYTLQAGTCNQNKSNNDAKILFDTIVNLDKVGVSEGTTYMGTTYAATPSMVSSGKVFFNNLKHNTSYTFRFFDQQDLCYRDTTLKTMDKVCCTLAIVLGAITQPTCPNNDGAIALILSGNSNATTFQWSNNATSKDIANLNAGTYTVDAFDNGCTAGATFDLQVQSINTVINFCQGETFNLFVTDPSISNIQWLKDGVPLSGENGLLYVASQAGVYTYTSNGIGGCSVGQCCPIQLKLKADCCKPVICTSVKITRKN